MLVTIFVTCLCSFLFKKDYLAVVPCLLALRFIIGLRSSSVERLVFPGPGMAWP